MNDKNCSNCKSWKPFPPRKYGRCKDQRQVESWTHQTQSGCEYWKPKPEEKKAAA